MKQKTCSFSARFASLCLMTVGVSLAFDGAVQAQTNAAPKATAGAAPTAKPASDQPAAPSTVQATNLSQISGAEITKTGEVITGINIKDCKVLTADDYRLIRRQESLKMLGFAHGPDDASLKILEGMPAIESFSTNGTAITDAGLASLTGFKTLQGLTFFHPGSGMTGTGLAALASLPKLTNLTVAGSLAFADPGMAAVGQLSHLKAFRTWHSGVTVEGVKALASLKELTTLTVGQRLANKPPATINDEGVAVLATIPSLEFLTLNEARLGLPALSKLGQLPNLKTLTLGEIDIPESDIATLKARLPKAKIIWNAPSPGSQKRIDGIFGPAVASAAPGATPLIDAKK